MTDKNDAGEEDDELRDPNYLNSLLYKISLDQVRRAVRFLSKHEKARIFKEVMKEDGEEG